MKKVVIQLVSVVFLVSGCVSAPVDRAYQSPIQNTSYTSDFDFFNFPFTKENTHNRYLNDQSDILYQQGSGGGGAALFILAPGGKAAYNAGIGGQTQSDVARLYNKISINPREIFSNAVLEKDLKFPISKDTKKLKIASLLCIRQIQENQLQLATVIVINDGYINPRDSTQPPFFGDLSSPNLRSYYYVLPQKYTIEELSNLNQASLDHLKQEVVNGFKNLIDFQIQERNENVKREKVIMFHTDFIYAPTMHGVPNFGRVASRSSDVIWIRTELGVYALPVRDYEEVEVYN
jgi:hypothetical protein